MLKGSPVYNKKNYDKNRYQQIRAERIAKLPPDPISLLKPTERAYIAGIIDGEGTIYARNERKTIYPTIAVHMTDKAVIAWLQGRIKAQTVWTINRKDKPRYKTQYLFRICGKRAKLLCKSIYPFLIVKRKHAEIVLEWPIDARIKGLTEKTQQIRTQLGEELTALNGYVYQKRHK